MLKVAYLHTPVTAGGASKSLVLLLKSLKNQDIYKKIYYPYSTNENVLNQIKKLSDDVEQVNLNSINCNQAYKTKIKRAKKIIKEDYSWFLEKLKKDSIDILHVNSSIYPHIIKFIKENSDIKVVTHVREVVDKNCGFLSDFVTNGILKSDHIIFISENEEKPFKGNKYKSTILLNPFDFEEIKNIPENRYFKKNKEFFYVGMMGAFTKMKGQILFLKVARNILRKSKKYHFVLIGYPPKNKSIVKRIIKLFLFRPEYKDVFDFYFRLYGLKKYFTLITPVANVFPILKDLDFYVRPSLSKDPWGRDIIENMAIGNTVIATGNSNVFIENGVNGYLIDSLHEDDISKFIYKQNKLNEEIIINTIKRKCSLINFSEKMHVIYDTVRKN